MAKKYKIREGVTMRFLQTGEATNNAYSLIEAEYNEGEEFPDHIHTRENELFYVIEGDIDFRLDKNIINIKSGNSIHLPKNVKHGFKVNSEKSKVLIFIEPAGLEKYFQFIGKSKFENPNFNQTLFEAQQVLNSFGVIIL